MFFNFLDHYLLALFGLRKFPSFTIKLHFVGSANIELAIA